MLVFSGNPEEAGLDRTYSLDTLPQEVASSGVGDFRDDSVRLAHPDGSCAADFRFESCEVVSGAYSIPGMPALYDTDKKNSETLIIKMKEKASGAILHLYYGVWEEENVITRTASLTNAGKEPIYIEKFFVMQYGYDGSRFGPYQLHRPSCDGAHNGAHTSYAY